MKRGFYQQPIVGGPETNVMLADGDKCGWKNVVEIGVLVVGVVVLGVGVLTMPIEGAAVVAVAV